MPKSRHPRKRAYIHKRLRSPLFSQARELLRAHRAYERALKDDLFAGPEAYPALVQSWMPVLLAGELDATLACMVETSLIEGCELERLRTSAQGLVTSRGLRVAGDRAATAFLIAVPLGGITTSWSPDVLALRTALSTDSKALLTPHAVENTPSPVVVPLPAPVHPLAFTRLSMTHRFSLLGELLPGPRERPILNRLCQSHDHLVASFDEKPAVVLADVQIWPALLIVEHASLPPGAPPVEMLLDQASLDEFSWAATRAWVAGQNLLGGVPHLFDAAVLQSLFLRIRETGHAQARALGIVPDQWGDLHLAHIQPSLAGNGLELTLSIGEQILGVQFVAFPWLALAGSVNDTVGLLLTHFNQARLREEGSPLILPRATGPSAASAGGPAQL